MNNTPMKSNSRVLLNRTIAMVDGAYAPTTIRAYKGNFEKFIQFCESENEQALPAHPTTVGKFIQMLTKSGLKSSSIRLAFASISTIHKLNELPDPTQSPIAKLELRRMHRTIGRSSNQALGITSPILRKMIQATGTDLRGLRNRALLMIAYESLCRRSELVSLRVEDIECYPNQNGARVRLRKSKTDQNASGVWIQISADSFSSLVNWLTKANIDYGFIFRGILPSGEICSEIKPAQINRIYKSLAKLANLPEETIKDISGHSIRVGAAQDLMNSGASLPILMNRGRWSKTDTAIRYIENSSTSSSPLTI